MTKKTSLKPIAVALGTSFAISVAQMPQAAAAEQIFGLNELSGGYMVAYGGGGGRFTTVPSKGYGEEERKRACAGGACGGCATGSSAAASKATEAKSSSAGSTEKKADGKCAAGKCGAGKCGASKCGEKSCGACASSK